MSEINISLEDLSMSNKFVRFSSILSLSTLVFGIISLLVKILLVQNLDPISYGKWATVWLRFLFLIMVSTFAIQTPVLIRLSQKNFNKENIDSTITAAFVIMVPMTFLSALILFNDLRKLNYSNETILIVLLGLVSYSYILLNQAILKSKQKIHQDSTVNVLHPGFRLLGLIFLFIILMKSNINLVMFVFYASYLVVLIISVILVVETYRVRLDSSSIIEAKILLRDSIYYFTMTVSVPAILYLGAILIGDNFRDSGELELGYYPITMVQLFVANIGAVLYIILPEKKLTLYEINTTIRKPFILGSIGYWILTLLLINFDLIKILWNLLFTTQHQLGFEILLTFSLFVPFYLYSTVMIFSHSVLKGFKEISLVSIASFVLTVILIMLLWNFVGIFAIPLGYGIYFIIFSLYFLITIND